MSIALNIITNYIEEKDIINAKDYYLSIQRIFSECQIGSKCSNRAKSNYVFISIIRIMGKRKRIYREEKNFTKLYRKILLKAFVTREGFDLFYQNASSNIN